MEVIAASRRGDVVRIARLRGDMLSEFWLWDLHRPDGVGDIYTGRVDAVMPGLAGRFVELGGMTGFLPDSAGGKQAGVGTYLTVEVTRGPQGGKGPRLAVRDLAPGDKPGLRERGPGPLLELAARAPGLSVRVDDYALMAALRPALGARLVYDAQAFDAVLEDEVAALALPTAALPHGATLHITPAPAAVLLDIDAGGASAMAPLALNLALIPELCRQISLRNLSGGILIDFAGLKPRERAKLHHPLTAALAADHLAPNLLGFSHLGFAELNRRRIRPPLHEIYAA